MINRLLYILLHKLFQNIVWRQEVGLILGIPRNKEVFDFRPRIVPCKKKPIIVHSTSY